MPLVDLVTNLKSLKYGDFGTEAPFVTKDINNPPNSSGLAQQAERRIDDLNRFTRFLISGNGASWALKQGALNIIEQNIINQDKSLGGKLASGAWSTVKMIASTTAQIPVNGTGTHFVEGFNGKNGYLPRVQGHILSREGAFIETNILEDVDNPWPTDSKVLRKYLKIEEDKNKKQQIKGLLEKSPLKPTRELAFDFDKTDDVLQYRVNTLEEGGNLLQHTVNKTSTELGNRNNQGYVGGGDIITARKPFTAPLSSFDEDYEKNRQEKEGDVFYQDQIKFNIKTIVPRSNDEPEVTRLDFRAYLDSFSDSFNGEWSGTKYIGRAEDLYSYSGFRRQIQFGFKVAASSQGELQPLYLKLNKLVGSTTPTYVGQNYMRGTFNQITIGDYFKDLPGFIESISLSWSTEYPWDNRNGDLGEMPTVLDVQISYQPIHSFAPSSNKTFIGDDFLLNFDNNLDNETTVTA